MSPLTIENVTLLIQIAFGIGAITDGLAILPMLSRRIGARLFGGDVSRANAAYRYAMRIGASLMAGWTLLLIWGAMAPLERRDLLLLTVFPVISGIVWATVVGVRERVILRSRVIPLWIHLGLVSLLYLVVYVLSMPLVS